MNENRNGRYQNEGAMRIMEALNAVDEELLERCGIAPESEEGVGKTTDISKYRKLRKPLWKMGRAWAACLVLLAVGAISWNGLRLIMTPKGASNSSGSASGGAANENLTSDAAAPEEWFAGEAETEAKTTEKAPAADEADALRGEEGAQRSDGVGNSEAQASESKEFDIEDSKVGSDTGVISDNSGIEAVTEEKARNWLPLGAYIPQNLPKGYSMEIAYINPETQSVTMTWSRGMDSIMITISSVEPSRVKTVDIAKPETYDVRLYEIPYAETVPAEYRGIFNNPVFAAEDLSLEIVSSRLKSYNDSGDTDTPRGNFEVLYPDGILLRFNGRGTPEEIWDMFN